MIDRDHIEDIMYGRKKSGIFGALLFFLSLVYGMLVRLRTYAFAVGLFRTNKLPCPVISVGNITVGGTGKTPMVIHIAGLLHKRGKRPLVLSRGYGRENAASMAVVSDGTAQLIGADLGGDEPALIANQLPTVPVVVGRDRYRAGAFAVGQFHPDCVILDDGFQHVRLKRDLNIALIDAGDPFGNGRLLPAGILREPLSALRRADVIVITRADQAGDIALLKQTIRRHTAAQIFTARYIPRNLVNTASGEFAPLTVLRGSRVFTFAGIARPGSLDSLLSSLGATVSGTIRFPDHHLYTAADLEQVLQSAENNNASMVVTTEKDSVRLKGMAPAGVWALRIDLDVMERAAWEAELAGKL